MEWVLKVGFLPKINELGGRGRVEMDNEFPGWALIP